MLEQVLTIVIGIMGGLSVGIQSPIVSAIGKKTGAVASTFIVHVSGALFSGIILLARGGENIGELRSLPVWMLGCGLFGVIIILTINYTIPRVGATAAVMLIIIGQLAAGVVIDHFGLLGTALRPIDGHRLLAIVFLLIGGYLIVS